MQLRKSSFQEYKSQKTRSYESTFRDKSELVTVMPPIHSPRQHARRRQTAGFSLTEMGVIIGILGLILGAIWVIAAQVYLNHKVRMAEQQLLAIIHNVRAIFAEQGGITDPAGGGLTQALDQLRAFPLEMRMTSTMPTGVLYHALSNATVLGQSTFVIPGNGKFPGGSALVFADSCNGTPLWAPPVPEPCFDVVFLKCSTGCLHPTHGQHVAVGVGSSCHRNFNQFSPGYRDTYARAHHRFNRRSDL